MRHLRYPAERLLYAMVRATGAGGYGFRREAVVSAEYPGHVRISVFGIREVSSNCALSPIEKHKELMVKLGEGVKVVME